MTKEYIVRYNHDEMIQAQKNNACGAVMISGHVWRDHIDIIHKIQQRMVTLHIDHNGFMDVYVLVGYSPDFEVLEEGTETPFYDVIVSKKLLENKESVFIIEGFERQKYRSTPLKEGCFKL